MRDVVHSLIVFVEFWGNSPWCAAYPCVHRERYQNGGISGSMNEAIYGRIYTRVLGESEMKVGLLIKAQY